MQVRNQSYLRRKNKQSVIDLLRKKSQSYSDLARELKLSNTAIGKIVDDLIEQNLVLRAGETKGRTGISLSVNADYGCIVAVDLSRFQVSISVADFASNILVGSTLEMLSFRESGDIDKIFKEIHSLLESEKVKDKQLLCISIASPGKIDKESGEFILNPRFHALGSVSFRTIFGKEFGCPVVVRNDINLALLGEKTYGTVLKDVDNALMLHVDVGVGSALLIGGKVYEGSHGFAGEIGYFKLNMFLTDEDNYGNLNYANYYDSTSLFTSLDIVKREIFLGRESILQEKLQREGRSWNDLTIQEILAAYRAQDELVVKVINSAAGVMGTFAYSLCEFLDVEKVVLIGSVVELGEEYLRNIAKYTKGYPVAYSQLAENATTMGAINAGILFICDEIL